MITFKNYKDHGWVLREFGDHPLALSDAILYQIGYDPYAGDKMELLKLLFNKRFEATR